ncbi:MAG TPA: hypothetical protein ENK55_06120 [Actinobacteria bacterium]|nr:hypothetical protein [Actinomycetota bacterium]
MPWMVLAIVVAALLGLVRGGRLANLVELRVRGLWLLVLGIVIQTPAAFVTDRRIAVALMLGSYLPLLAFAWRNRQAAGMWIVGIGVLMNFSVIAANGGMPVLEEAVALAGLSAPEVYASAKHVPLDATTRLPFLGDLLPLPGSVVSLGDILLTVGLGVFLEDELRRPPRLFARKVQAVPGSAARRA